MPTDERSLRGVKSRYWLQVLTLTHHYNLIQQLITISVNRSLLPETVGHCNYFASLQERCSTCDHDLKREVIMSTVSTEPGTLFDRPL